MKRWAETWGRTKLTIEWFTKLNDFMGLVHVFCGMVRARFQAASAYLYRGKRSRICQSLGPSDGITARRFTGIDHLSRSKVSKWTPRNKCGRRGIRWNWVGDQMVNVNHQCHRSTQPMAPLQAWTDTWGDFQIIQCAKQQRCGVVMVLPGTQH